MRYYAGRFDLESLTFTPETAGIVDHAFGPGNDSRARGFYASNVLPAPDGRQLLFAWVSGFRDADGAFYMRRGEGLGRGWNGCVSLPRVMALDSAGRLRQSPAAELRQLRHAPASLSRTVLEDTSQRVREAAGNTLEIVARLQLDSAATTGLRLGGVAGAGGDAGSRLLGVARAGRDTVISYDGSILDVAGTRVPLRRPAREPLTLHLFLDRSVLEAFIDDGRACVTRVIDPLPAEATIEVFADRGRAVVESLDIWQMRPIW